MQPGISLGLQNVGALAGLGGTAPQYQQNTALSSIPGGATGLPSWIDSKFGANQPAPKTTPLARHDYNTPVQPVKKSHDLDFFSGLFEELRKEGANEDFIQGMMKEAFDFSPYVEGVKDFFKPQLKSDRHNILPFLSNRHLGALGGLVGGKLLSDSAGLEGISGLALPALGALGGYNMLPRVMNNIKDAPGTGVNAVHPLAKAYNQKHPVTL